MIAEHVEPQLPPVSHAQIRWRWILVAAPCLLLTHHVWLPWAASPLIVATSVAGQSDHACLLGGDGEFDLVAEWIERGDVKQVLCFAVPPSRLVRHQVLPSYESQRLEVLLQRGVAPEQVRFVPYVAERDHGLREEERLLAFLDRQQRDTVRVCCPEFSSRWVSWRLARHRQRIELTVIPDRRFSAKNWWRSRDGVKAVLYGWFDLTWYFCCGPEPELGETWDERQYEADLRNAP